MLNLKQALLSAGVALALVITMVFSPIASKVAEASSTTQPLSTVTRLAGADRYETAAKISQEGWVSSENVILAAGSDEHLVDALAAAPLAKLKNAPILLTELQELNHNADSEIKRLGVKTIYLVTGKAVFSQQLLDRLTELNVNVIELGGTDRFETAINIANQLGTPTKIAISTAWSNADALSVAPIAAAKGIPILLSDVNQLPAEVQNYIASVEKGITQSYVIGGEGVVSNSVLNALPNPKRLGGVDRYDTNVQILKNFFTNLETTKTYVANGKDAHIVDALAAAPLAAQTNSPLILSNGSNILDSQRGLSELGLSNNVIALGGEVILSNEVLGLILSDVLEESDQLPSSSNSNNNNSNSNNENESNNNAILSKSALITAVANAELGTVTLGSDIDLGGDALDLNRALILDGSGKTLTGNVSVNTAGTTLKNLTITGDLVLAEGIGEGDANINGVTVLGNTVVKGGGTNSIHFTDSVLATVIVNKNTGTVRIVVEGNTNVIEVQLETPTLVQESGLTSGATGIQNVTISDALQTSGNEANPQVQLLGSFETVNSRATNIQIQLSEGTDIRTLVLNAAATVLGTGTINMAQINTNGSTLSLRPQNVVLDNGTSVQVNNEVITTSYSNQESTSLIGVEANQASINLSFDSFVAGLTDADFNVSATLEGVPYMLENLTFDSIHSRFDYDPVPLSGNLGKHLKISVSPSSTSSKVTTAGAITAETVITTGFGGRVTDVSNIGIEGAIIEFRQGVGTTSGEVVGTVTTDRYGYYVIALPPGTYTGEISGPGLVNSYMIANAASDAYLADQNETAIRAAGINEVKIMLTWGQSPRDEDSHLLGPNFHTWYADKQYKVDDIVYADLDWDDTQSYGPETTTVRHLVDGIYKFYVHNFSQDGDLRDSGATVRVFMGRSTEPNYTFNVPTGEGEELYWQVFEMQVSGGGQNIVVTPINTMSFIPMDLLFNKIAEAEQLLAQAVVGDQPGNYPQSAVDMLTQAIADAQAVVDASSAGSIDVGAAMYDLQYAINEFGSLQYPSLDVVKDIIYYRILDISGEIADYERNAQIGDQPGQYPQTAVDSLEQVQAEAQAVLDNSTSTYQELIDISEKLNQAIETFYSSQNPINYQQTVPGYLRGYASGDPQLFTLGYELGEDYNNGQIIFYLPDNYILTTTDIVEANISGTSTSPLISDDGKKIIINSVTATAGSAITLRIARDVEIGETVIYVQGRANSDKELSLGIEQEKLFVMRADPDLYVGNLQVNDIGNNANGSDVGISFEAAQDESKVLEYGVVLIPEGSEEGFDPHNLSQEKYIKITPNGSQNYSISLSSEAVDYEGNPISNGNYKVFLITVPNPNSTTPSINAIKGPIMLTLDDSLVVTVHGYLTGQASANPPLVTLNYKLGEDFSNGQIIFHFPVNFVTTSSAITASILESSTIPLPYEIGSDGSIITVNAITATTGSTITLTIDRNIEIGETVIFAQGKANPEKELSSGIQQEELHYLRPDPVLYVGNLQVNDIGDNGNGSDVGISFEAAQDESKVTEYRVVLIPEGSEVIFDKNNLPEGKFTAIIPNNSSTSTNYNITLPSDAVDIEGNLITNGSYKIFVVSVTNSTPFINALRGPITFTLINSSVLTLP